MKSNDYYLVTIRYIRELFCSYVIENKGKTTEEIQIMLDGDQDKAQSEIYNETLKKVEV
jgi:hypothetical protein